MLLATNENVSEAAVSLRLAFYLLSLPGSDGYCRVSIDGAQVRIGGKEIFPIVEFISSQGWSQIEQAGKNLWQGVYKKGRLCLEIGSFPGTGDVIALVGDKRIRAECKKGYFVQRAGNPEYPKLREALGQLLTADEVRGNDILVAAVPDTQGYRNLVENWRQRPLIRRTGIRIALVGMDGAVEGLDI